jgi:hypothetical protein
MQPESVLSERPSLKSSRKGRIAVAMSVFEWYAYDRGVLAALGLAEYERIAGFVPTRRHFVSSGAACNAQYFEGNIPKKFRDA